MKSEKTFKRKLDGKVISAKCDKTIVVNVIRRFKHPLYSKFVHDSKRYHAHDEQNTAKVGDNVTIIESRPYSKTKTWELIKVKS